MHSLSLDPDKKQKKWETIQTIAKNNNVPRHLLHKLNRYKAKLITHTKKRNTKSGPHSHTIVLK